MKLHRLELTGFGPFRVTQTVDFDAFCGDGVFLISGRTGAGKSSILDGVSFALYGSVPRYDGGERRLRSDHCALGDPTEVRLEFTVGDTRWRVARAPEYDRPAKRGGGVTTEPTRAELEELVDGVWVGRAAKPRDVALLLDGILGLNAQQFQQVILLAQNRFSRFLLASPGERQTLLRTLFGTRRFEEYKDDLEERRRQAQRRLEGAGERAGTLLDLAERLIDERGLGGGDRPDGLDLSARREAADLALQRAEYQVEQQATERERTDAAAAAAADAHAALVAQAKTLGELVAARAELTRLEDDAPRMADERARLERALAAEALRATLAAATRAEAAAAAATAARAQADADWIAAGGDAADDLDAVLEALTGDLALWGAAEEAERDLVRVEADLAAREAEVASRAQDIATLDEQRALVPAERDRLTAQRRADAAVAARLTDLQDRRDALRARLAAAQEAVGLAEAAARADLEYARRSAESGNAADAVTLLLQRRLAGHAGELAAQLLDGEPCSVCGSLEHPHPAAAATEPVTDDDLTTAEAARDAAAEAARTAGDAARAARDRLADANARAGGGVVDELAVQLTAAEADLRSAEEAHDRVRLLDAQLTELDDLDAAARAERAALDARLAEDRAAVAGLQATADALRADVRAARGTHDTVAARVAEARGRRDLARDCLAARERAAEQERALATAVADRDAGLAGSVFDSAVAAADALLDPPERAAVDTRLSAHAAALAAIRARLLALELESIDLVDPPDLAASEAAATAADTARAAAIAAQRDAQNAADRLRDLLVQTDAAYADVAAIADEAAAITRLADTVAGRAPNTMKMDLETFVLAAELEEIVAAATLRLAEMSAGRYSLHHSDARQARNAASGLGIEVLDAHTGLRRSPQSLSGGETFLASLALALGLAEVVTNRAGGLRLDTLFVDEGFGSLDPETLDLAMRTLDELRAGGRTVGVISHVEAMKEQLPAQLVVTATPEGPSVIRQDVAVPGSYPTP
ncbi:AAA family ATPase [Microbacterium saccharophilum]|uniref:Nuclease SbcCD subunit C n=1 Tax=Microbacterium saccharophilum TaxID=1213358 RepID=A0A5C8HZX4_9MICO|nr:AAA family ATPase [Microbacterium saccharophilum]TXK11278.1 AAA family ATPase [Microbacterium saccharophilum]GEP48608.1 nuclease SbcCD subunit C [Microbacterium saccharophilum]